MYSYCILNDELLENAMSLPSRNAIIFLFRSCDAISHLHLSYKTELLTSFEYSHEACNY